MGTFHMQNESGPAAGSQPAPVVLVTGASSGIGLALARMLRHTKYRVAATAREGSLPALRDELEETERFRLFPLDVTHGRERAALIHGIEAEWGGVDVLINNAGISYRSVVEHMSEAEEVHQLATNFLGPMALIRLVLPSMRRKRAGRIINVSSVSGMMAIPTMSSYSASKFALEGATEALWYEMRPWGIKVSLVQPGFVHSNSFQNVILPPPALAALDDPREPYHYYYSTMARFVERLMRLSPSTPESIARVILRTMARPRPPLRVPATPDAWVFYYLRRFMPRRLYLRLLSRNLPDVQLWGLNIETGEGEGNELPAPNAGTAKAEQPDGNAGEAEQPKPGESATNFKSSKEGPGNGRGIGVGR